MVILIYDRYNRGGAELFRILKEDYGETNVHSFMDRDELFKYAENHIFHVVFMCLYPDNEDMGGAERIMHMIPDVNLIIVSEDERFLRKAVKLHASGYMTFPVTEKNTAEEMENLLYPVYDSVPEIRTDGERNTKVYIDDKPVCFTYEKTGELLKLLLDRDGGMISTGEMIDSLFEEGKAIDKSRSYLQNLRSDLFRTLSFYGLSDAVKHRRGRMWLDTTQYVRP